MVGFDGEDGAKVELEFSPSLGVRLIMKTWREVKSGRHKGLYFTIYT